jgi:hypothetical protein
MLEQLFGAALIGIGALTFYVRLLGRSMDERRPFDDGGPHAPPSPR